MHKIGILFLAGASLSVHLSVRAALPPVTEFKLDNGLKVVLAPSKRVPNLTYFTFFHVGSRNERPGITGVSHFMEHMMFLGAKKYGPKQFDLTMERAGGSNNAFTSNDMTAYNDEIPAEFLSTLIDMEVDRLKDIAFDPKLFESERHVVQEERRVSEDNPDSPVDEAMNAAAFKASPYRWPVIGWMKDVESISRDEGYAYIKTYYAPNNATLVIAGDFDPAATETLIRQRYGEIPAQKLPPAPVNSEPPQTGPIRVELRRDVEAPIFARGYKVPAIRDADTPALNLLAEILGGGEQAVLTQALVQEAGIATDIWVGTPNQLDPGLFSFFVHLRPGESLDKARTLFDASLDKFRAAGATTAQLKRAQARVSLGYLRALETNNGLASALGRADLLHGDWRVVFSYKDKLEAVTVEDIKRVAGKYFGDTEMTEVVLKPTAKAAETEPASAPKKP